MVVSIHALRRFYRRWLPAALVVTALANLVANEFLPDSAQSFRLHQSGSLTHLVHTEQATVDRRYGIYMEMGDAMAGGVLFVPSASEVDPDLAKAFSDVRLKEREYDSRDVPADLLPEGEPLGVFQAGDDRLPYWILTDGGDTTWWLGRSPRGLVIIPESVAPVPKAEP